MVNIYSIYSVSFRTITYLFCALKISSKSAREEERQIKYKKIGEIIKIARNKLNLTLSDLSRISDISEIELWLLENGRIKNPKCVFLFSIIYIFISYSLMRMV